MVIYSDEEGKGRFDSTRFVLMLDLASDFQRSSRGGFWIGVMLWRGRLSTDIPDLCTIVSIDQTH